MCKDAINPPHLPHHLPLSLSLPSVLLLLLLPTASSLRYPQPRHFPHLFFSPPSNHVTHLPPHPHPQSRPLSHSQKPNILLNPLLLPRCQNPTTLRLEPQLHGPCDRDLEREFRNWLGGVVGDLGRDFDEAGVMAGSGHRPSYLDCGIVQG